MPIVIDKDLCEGCGDCVEVCNSDSLQIVEAKAIVDNETCCECVACVDECKQKAIELKD